MTKHQFANWGLFAPGRYVTRAALALAIALVPVVLPPMPAHAQAFVVLYSFTGDADGGHPAVGLALDSLGGLYGTTLEGGTFGQGTVFKIVGNAKIVLYNFTGGTNGAAPGAGLLRAAGDLFGTTIWGGAYGAGTVFKLNPITNKETVLYSFTGGSDGAYPQGVLVRDTAGNLYGTASAGGASGQGTVFMLDPTGHETTLHSFAGIPDGANPYAGLVRDKLGNLYGTTYRGGAAGQGVVFKVEAAGSESVFYSFNGGADGLGPEPGLVRDPQGNLYGTTFAGGSSGCGAVFKLDPTGNETVLHSFCSTWGDGFNPQAGLVRDRQGNLYGTSSRGGAFNWGTVFMLDTLGNETVLYNFTDQWDGGYPMAGLVQDAVGNLYGTTSNGGYYGGSCYPAGCGTVFMVPMTRTATTVSSNANPSYAGQPVFFTATVSSPLGPPPDDGTVTFMNGTTILGTETLLGGTAIYVTGSLHTGGNPITAKYGGASGYAASTSNKIRQVVTKNTTTTTLTSSPNPSVYLQPVNLAALVWASMGPPPDGETVTFMHGTTVLGTAALSIGEANLWTILPVGTDPIKAVYHGDATFLGSTSNVVDQIVENAER